MDFEPLLQLLSLIITGITILILFKRLWDVEVEERKEKKQDNEEEEKNEKKEDKDDDFKFKLL